MKKKILLISGIVLTAGIIFTVLYFVLKPGGGVSNAIDAVAGNPALIIETKDFSSLITSLKTDNLIYQELNIINRFDASNSIMHCLDSLSKLNSIKSVLSPGKLIFSYENQGGLLLQTAIVEIPENIKAKSFRNSLEDELKSSGSIKEREYKDIIIFEYTPKNSIKFFYTIKNQLFILSYSAVCIEKSVDQLIEGKNIIEKDAGFASVYSSAGKNEPANLYLNMTQLSGILSKSVLPELQTNLANLENFSGWTGLDLNADLEKISLNGFIYDKDSAAYFTKILKSQQVVEINSLEILPDNTALYMAFAFNDYTAFDKSLSQYLKLTDKDKSREQAISDIKNSSGIDIRQAIYPMIENEICMSVTNAVSAVDEPFYYTIAGLKSQSAGILEMENIIKTLAKKSGKPEGDYKSEIRIDDNTKIACYLLPFKNLPELLFGGVFSKCSGEYVCFINNFMVFSDSKESLHKFAYDAFLNKTLETSIDHNLFLENFSDKSLMFAYFSFPAGDSWLKRFLSDTTASVFTLNRESVKRIGYVGYQINVANDMLYNNIVILHSGDIAEKPQTVWESRLENTVSSKPIIVLNHNDNSKEIIVQDEKNILYLLSNSGREVWRLQLDEQIKSKIYQIDLYKNGKFQYMFSTENKLHVIDRLGNYIEKFPVTLRSASTAPMALFDYENNKSYRILIPCADKKVYLYDANGSLVKGWEFGETEHEVKIEPAYYNLAGEEYIVFHDDWKSYFISRTGGTKVEFLTDFNYSDRNKIWIDNNSSPARFVCTDSKGTIHFLYSDGTQDSLKIKEFSDKHYFAVEDINSDGVSDFIFIDGKRLEVYNKSKKIILSYDFEGDVSAEPTFYKFPSNQTKIGLVCKSESKIYLINQDGSLFNGFPLHGLTPFSIGYLNNSENKFNLLVGGPENLLYNYEVNEN
jgi:hypothetical protein